MEASSERWVTVADSPHDHEREALAFLRGRLPDRDPVRVWSNFEFTTQDGRLYEVDALVVADTGVYLIEIKSHPGSMGGDANEWEWHTPEGRRIPLPNPRSLANRKAKAFKSLLERSNSFRRNRRDVPYVHEAIFLSDPKLVVTLSPDGRHSVYGRDPESGEETPRYRDKLGGIVDLLTNLDPQQTGRRIRRVDRPTGAQIVKAIEEIGIRERSSRRKIGDYVLGELLDDVEADRDTGVAYQDFLVTHSSFTDLTRRVRLYPLERNATTEQREIAVRAAKREFEILRPLDHPGIARPVEYTEHERGPALFFDHDPDALPLPRWMAANGEKLTVEERLLVFRAIAEAVAHAHGEGIFHRALAPSAITVAGTRADPVVSVTNWHTAARISAGTSHPTLSGTAHVEHLAAGDAVLYRAPEAGQAAARPATLDVFSLGCIAAFLVTGEQPAPTPAALLKQLTAGGAVTIEASADAVGGDLAEFVREATAADASERLSTVADVLSYLDMLEEDWTRPETADEPHVMAAHRGDTLCEGRFAVLGRLGQGASAFTLLAVDRTHDDRNVVLKAATGPDQNDVLSAEADALAQLHHPRIVQLLEGPLDIDGHTTLVLAYVGPEVIRDRDEPVRGPRTLADRIGDLGLEFVQRFGSDLLEALAHLEEAGIGHRDIKPANLGVTEQGAKHELHLVLYDFSLARTPVDRIDAGTQGYVDPFLKTRRGWDPAADRYSAAVVLHEMLTGERPRYGDGTTDPGLSDAALELELGRFPSELSDFFESALAPDVADRHDTAGEMQQAWRTAWTSDTAETAAFEVPSGTTAATPLAGLTLSTRALHALENVDVLSVGDLLGRTGNPVRGQQGVGTKTRNEILAAIAALREHVRPADDTAEGAVDDSDRLADMARRLIPRSARDGSQADVLRRYVGLADPLEPWPSQSDLARETGITRQRVSQQLGKARTRWAKQPDVTSVRGWLASTLPQFNDVATFDQLVERLAAHRADDNDAELHRHAVAVLRAALTVEDDRREPRWVGRRVGSTTVVTAADSDNETSATGLADYVTALAERTDALVEETAVISRSDLVAALRSISPPPGANPLPDAHLAEVAASCSERAAVTNRLELYRSGLSAEHALTEARRALVGLSRATPDEIRRKVAARFPEAEPLPDRPELDQLLSRAGLSLAWDPASERYQLPSLPSLNPTATGSVSRFGTQMPAQIAPVEIDVAADFEQRLERSTNHGGLLVLMVDRHNLERAQSELDRHAVTTVDLEDWLLAEIRRRTADGKPSWERVIEADTAGPGTPAWSNLQRLLDSAMGELTQRLSSTAGTVLLTHLGLLARYDRLDTVAAWRDIVHSGDQPLRALWLLTATTTGADVPFVDDRPVPVLTANEHTKVPAEWLRNAHRAGQIERAGDR